MQRLLQERNRRSYTYDEAERILNGLARIITKLAQIDARVRREAAENGANDLADKALR